MPDLHRAFEHSYRDTALVPAHVELGADVADDAITRSDLERSFFMRHGKQRLAFLQPDLAQICRHFHRQQGIGTELRHRPVWQGNAPLRTFRRAIGLHGCAVDAEPADPDRNQQNCNGGELRPAE